MGMTMIEKILARASGRAEVKAGDIVVCHVDSIVLLDMLFTSGTDPLPKRVCDPERISVVLDHGVPSPTIYDSIGHSKARAFAKQHGIRQFYDVGNHGICHQVMLEEGLAVPGTVLACMDSHTCASGALNCAARGLGRIEMLQILCKGETWYKVGPTVRYVLKGRRPSGVYGKDIFLAIAGHYGDAANENQEFGGPGLAGLPFDDRATIATMAAEVSAEFCTFPIDQVAREYLRGRIRRDWTPVESDADASYLDVREIDLDQLEPWVSRPDFVPNNTAPVGELEGTTVQQAFIGSCANGKLEDIRTAAEILRGRRVHPDTRLIVTPASQKVHLEAARRGYIETLIEAGATFTSSTCGACFGYHMGVVGPGERCITSSTRNFKGRMGSPDSEVYIASSATVAASAIEGRIADPRKYLRTAA
jgi:3-isopropylmalate/(R)-2-methylmalate dehydratase large subunit